MNTDSASIIENSLQYSFINSQLLQQALTHPSHHHEHEKGEGDYQRLEFLGDAVLGMLLAEMLYIRFPLLSEGDLSRLRANMAGQVALASIAREQGIGQCIKLGRGEIRSAGSDKDSILADVLEALIAAVYLDGGIDKARDLIIRLFSNLLDKKFEMTSGRDAKSDLQEFLSSKGMSPPKYSLMSETGPAHARFFTFAVLVEGDVIGEGEGCSKKLAQQAAAARAIERLTESKPES